MSEAFVSKETLATLPEAVAFNRFGFGSRRSGQALFILLGVSWVLDIVTLFSLIADRSDGIAGVHALDPAFTGTMAVVIGLVYLANCLAFLLWIYKVHQDLGQLFPDYPFSPGGAVLHVSIPFYNFYGIWKVFNEIGEQMIPGFEIWARLASGFYVVIASGLVDRVELGAAELLQGLLTLSLTTVWLIVTLKVHRALGERNGAVVYGGSDAGGAFSEPNGISMRRSKVRLIAAFLGVCALLAVAGIIIVPLFQSGAAWFDDAYQHLGETLAEHYGIAESGADLWLEFTWLKAPGEDTAVWLNIDLETLERCTKGAADPCEALADEIAYITLNEYGRIDELAGLRVQITTVDKSGEDSAAPNLEKQMTITEWRHELATFED